MKHTFTRGFWAIALTAAFTAPAAAQVVDRSDNTAYGTSSAEFLLLGAGARGTALGGSFAALATDVTALYYNPAGLAQLARPGVMVSTLTYIADTRYTWAGMAYPMGGGSSALGISVGSFGFSEQPVYDIENPDGDGRVYSVNETFISGTYGKNFSDRFSAGASLKFISDKLGSTSASAFAFDLGTNFHAMIGQRPIRAAFVIQNLGSTLQHQGPGVEIGVVPEPPLGTVPVPREPQPASFRTKEFGLPVMFRVSVSLDVLTQGTNRVTVLSEFTQPNNTKPGASAGLEWAGQNLGNSGFSLAARGSYTIQPDNEFAVGTGAGFASKESSGSFTSDGLALGGGIGYGKGNLKFGFDYAWRNLGPLGSTNFFSFSLGW
ncbi:MAG TPA: PorV/PorQ family protein [Gemmatimonadales bacterium]|jgi:hypothetical protein|nr:PorV/PorQ family protein [Gemmatimonadales bacterium]